VLYEEKKTCKKLNRNNTKKKIVHICKIIIFYYSKTIDKK
jgi:hypothetical protein